MRTIQWVDPTWNDATKNLYEYLCSNEERIAAMDKLVKDRQGVLGMKMYVGDALHPSRKDVDWEALYYSWNREGMKDVLKKKAPNNTIIGGRNIATSLMMRVVDEEATTRTVTFHAVSVHPTNDWLRFENITDEVAYLLHLSYNEDYTYAVIIPVHGSGVVYTSLIAYTEQLGELLYGNKHAFSTDM